jgi:hypothetical protein
MKCGVTYKERVYRWVFVCYLREIVLNIGLDA